LTGKILGGAKIKDFGIVGKATKKTSQCRQLHPNVSGQCGHGGAVSDGNGFLAAIAPRKYEITSKGINLVEGR
jgi:hypothetical protein